MDINLEKNLNEFEILIHKVPFGPSGMFNSEIFVVYSLYKHLNCNLFIESGIDWGVSTIKFLNLIADDYIAIDINPNCFGSRIKSDRYYFISKDSQEAIPEILKNYVDRNVFIMLDGPKNVVATNFKNKLLQYNNVMAVAIHDTYDGLVNDNEYRIFESSSNDEYNKKYFEKLNNISQLVNVYNLMNYNNKTYYESYPTGPGVSIYSKNEIKFII